ncbi:MAG TPA: MsnO8 family LLM class oxidoreductase, partial [Rubricoccaceae bacterium]
GTYAPGHPFASVRVVPSGVPLPPLYLLGSSGASAAFAGANGTGYAFASHFSPTPAAPAMEAYRAAFVPSEAFSRPHAVLALAAVVAESDAEARRLATTMELAFVRIRSGLFEPLPSPDEALAYPYTPSERAVAEAYRALSVVGTPDAVRAEIERRAAEAGADEVMVTTNVHGHPERLRSFELLADAFAMPDEASAIPHAQAA